MAAPHVYILSTDVTLMTKSHRPSLFIIAYHKRLEVLKTWNNANFSVCFSWLGSTFRMTIDIGGSKVQESLA